MTDFTPAVGYHDCATVCDDCHLDEDTCTGTGRLKPLTQCHPCYWAEVAAAEAPEIDPACHLHCEECHHTDTHRPAHTFHEGMLLCTDCIRMYEEVPVTC